MKKGFLVIVLMVSGTAGAQDNAFKAEVTPFGAYRFGGTFEETDSSASYKLEDSSSYGLIVNFRHSPNTQWELFYSKQSTEAAYSSLGLNDPLVDIDLQVVQLGGTYEFEGEAVRPYLALTLGGTHVKTRSLSSESETFWSASFGLGVQIRPNSRLGARLEVRAHGAFLSSSSSLFCSTGPDINVCSVRIEGDLMMQVETFAGLTFRF